jgi:riboflavin synthase alpha subunit
VAGTSLTVAGTGEGFFEVALVPTTLRETTLGALEPGDRVNLETDILARTLIAWIERHGPAMLERLLAARGAAPAG